MATPSPATIDRDAAEFVLPAISALAAAGPNERTRLLHTSESGLTPVDVARRRRVFGPNEPVRPKGSEVVATFLGNFTHMLALLLWFAAGLSFAAGIPELGAAIVAVIGVNGVFAFIQEYRAAQVVRSLMQRVAVQARVIRDGIEQRLPAIELVPGDIVHITAGDVIPADVVLLTARDLTLDLSMITGESSPVERDAGVVSATQGTTHATDLSCVAPAASGVVTGSGRGIVWATGPASTIGEIASLVEDVRRGESVLERQVTALSRLTAVLAVLAGAATLVVASASTGVEFLAALTFSTGVIVALVPEGLLPTLSVSLAIGARRMAERGAAVRRLSAVEAVGAVTVICTDKTGTLTQNTLSVLGFTDAAGSHVPSSEALLAAVLCNDAFPDSDGFAGDPIDVALARWAESRGCDIAAQRSAHPRTEDVRFESARRFMSVTCDVGGVSRNFIKGAPEALLALAADGARNETIAAMVDAAAGRGERVILLASGAGDEPPSVLGMVRLHDPPRPEARAAIEACQRARIRVIMLTGDHPATAQAVAIETGLADRPPPVCDGAMLDQLSDRQLLAKLRSDAVFARIDPRQKLRIATVLRRAGEVVVVTGDGINDAPALRAADVGVAMGRRGTEVAKQAADVVLADDNFATIVAAIQEGRSIKANIRRFASYVFTSNVAELAPFLLYVFLHIPLPLVVAQILAIDLGTDLLPAMALGAEPPSPRGMDAPPERAERPLMTRGLALKTFLFFGAMEAALGLAGFFAYFAWHGWRPFDSLDPYRAFDEGARSMTMLGVVAGQVGCVFAQRDGPLRSRLSLRSNSWIAYGLLLEIAIVLALVYLPGVNGMFSMAALAPGWLAILPAGAAVFFLADNARRAIAGR